VIAARLGFIVAATMAVANAGCSMSAPPAATPMIAERNHVQLAELNEGRGLLVDKCGNGCHVTPMPAEHTAREWPAMLDEMSARAHLGPRDRVLIERYLVAMATR